MSAQAKEPSSAALGTLRAAKPAFGNRGEGPAGPVALACPVVEDRLHERFVDLCEVRSPTGEERELADTVIAPVAGDGVGGQRG